MQIKDRPHWERLTSEFLDYNYRQGWLYEVTSAESHNAQTEHVGIKVDSELIGLASVRLKNIPLFRTGIAYVGGGPLTRRNSPDDAASLEICLAALREEYLDRRGYTLRILPPLQPNGGFTATCECFRAADFNDSPWPPPYQTIVVNIDRPLADIRKTLAQKWRNCLNNAERQKMTVLCGSEPELFEKFEALFNQFTDRKQIALDQGADFYRQLRAKSETDEGYYVALAVVDGQPVAGHLSTMLGDTGVSLLAATGEAGLKCKAAYLLQWHVIAEAHKRGLRWYDLGGIDPQGIPGVYHFKSGLGGREVTCPGPYQAAPGGMMGTVTPAVEKLYRWTRRRRI